MQPLWATDGIIRIGRSPECELILDSGEVSRHHARSEGSAGVFTLYEHGSANGTFVNGRRVRKRRAVVTGDVLRFGDREFRFAGSCRTRIDVVSFGKSSHGLLPLESAA